MRWAQVTIAAAAAVLLVALVGSVFGSQVDRDRYVAANEEVFELLPTYPGVRLTSTNSHEYRVEESSPIAGYTTLYLFALPQDAGPDEVAAFYERELRPDWTLVEKVTEPPYAAGPILNFRKGAAFASINLESWRAHVLEVAVDHDSKIGL